MKGKVSKSVWQVIISVMVILTLLTPFTQSSVTNVEITGTPAGWTDDIILTGDTSISDMMPSISVSGDDVHIAWRRFIGTVEIFYINSTDGGKNWESPTQISNSGVAASNPDMATASQNLHIVWDDSKIPQQEIFYRNSTDGGQIWNPEMRISTDDGFKSIVFFADSIATTSISAPTNDQPYSLFPIIG